jgi:hypothetical protein
MRLRLCTILVVAAMLLATSPGAALGAAQSEQQCADEVAPQDGFESQGLGLTRQELEDLYGAPEIGQGAIYFALPEVDVHKDGCDLILVFPLDGTGVGAGQEFALAQGLLPADAEFVGSFARGSTIRFEQASELWHSESLRERFAQMGEDRGGEILILFTYESSGFEPGPIERIELRTLELEN